MVSEKTNKKEAPSYFKYVLVLLISETGLLKLPTIIVFVLLLYIFVAMFLCR